MTRPYKVAEDLGYEVWARWDAQAEIFELFLEKECVAYIGLADTKEGARRVAKHYLMGMKEN